MFWCQGGWRFLGLGYFELGFQPFWNSDRPVALMARASDSKSEGWGFESLLACINYLNGLREIINGN